MLDMAYIDHLRAARQHLEEKGEIFDQGLSDHEIARVESQFGFVFPPDLRHFLQQGVPSGSRYPNWRRPGRKLQSMMDWPAEGICFDICNNAFWWEGWGKRPESDEEATAVATRECANAPKLIPIMGHSYLPATPCVSGNPVFSVHQADIIHRGANLAEYLFWVLSTDEFKEAHEDDYPVFGRDYRVIPLWTALAEANL